MSNQKSILAILASFKIILETHVGRPLKAESWIPILDELFFNEEDEKEKISQND